MFSLAKFNNVLLSISLYEEINNAHINQFYKPTSSWSIFPTYKHKNN